MKLVVLCLLGVATLSAAGKIRERGCVWDPWGRCMHECPVGTQSYSTGCGPLTPEPTCDEPNPVPGEGDICDYSACYCDPPTVRNTNTDTCVKRDQCPGKE